jgi:hypothetical protein
MKRGMAMLTMTNAKSDREEEEEKKKATNWTFFCHDLFININACLQCNVKRLQKKKEKRSICDRMSIVSNRIARMTK